MKSWSSKMAPWVSLHGTDDTQFVVVFLGCGGSGGRDAVSRCCLFFFWGGEVVLSFVPKAFWERHGNRNSKMTLLFLERLQNQQTRSN